MARVTLDGRRRLIANLRRTAASRVVVSAPVKAALTEVKREAERRGFGFTDRTGRLRRSLRMEQNRDARGRYQTGWTMVTRVPYAVFVELKRRTRDRRPGPPYWLAPATRRALARVRRTLRREISRGIAKVARRR